MTQRMIRGMTIAMVALAIAAILMAIAGPKAAHADGPTVPRVDVVQVDPRSVGASSSTVLEVWWKTGGPKVIEIRDCRTGPSSLPWGAFEISCGGAFYGPFGPSGYLWFGYNNTQPHWLFAVALLEDGRLIVSQPLLVNPNGIWNYTRPASRFD